MIIYRLLYKITIYIYTLITYIYTIEKYYNYNYNQTEIIYQKLYSLGVELPEIVFSVRNRNGRAIGSLGKFWTSLETNTN